jgi:hypothetical protein
VCLPPTTTRVSEGACIHAVPEFNIFLEVGHFNVQHKSCVFCLLLDTGASSIEIMAHKGFTMSVRHLKLNVSV